MPTTFYKMTGSGNDFVMLDGRKERSGDWPSERIVAICDRRDGVGADGLVILTPDEPGRVRMSFFNSDGSAAAMCGNAALCSTRLAAYLEMAPADHMALVTGAGTFPTRCAPEPWRAELNLPSFPLPVTPPIPLGPGEQAVWRATVGVPHLTVLVEDLEGVDLAVRGRELRFHAGAGPAGANANFVAGGRSGPWAMRTYERGVEGETLACGTGAVASAVALAASGKADLPLDIRSRSGRVLRVAAQLGSHGASEVWLAGEGRLVFTGLLGIA